jgi:hypothetical protein
LLLLFERNEGEEKDCEESEEGKEKVVILMKHSNGGYDGSY